MQNSSGIYFEGGIWNPVYLGITACNSPFFVPFLTPNCPKEVSHKCNGNFTKLIIFINLLLKLAM